ncbi:AI-2E family transporter [Dactylosporangium sp. NPDC000521]|uniref:AI-2E family transporter n=1 Tax=Dactylosporangium sp. NPDC000521 TaxID=3363975 RepID=UPI0036B4419B
MRPDSVRLAARVPGWLLTAAAVIGCLLVVGAGIYALIRLLVVIAPVVLAIVAALLLSALLGPLARRLRALRLPAWLASLLTVLLLLLVLLGSVVLIGVRVLSQFSDLRRQLAAGLRRLHDMLVSGPLHLDERQITELTNAGERALRSAIPGPAAAANAAEILTAGVLTLLLLFFVLRDGPTAWQRATTLVPQHRRTRVTAAAAAGWHSVTWYVRGIVVIALVDAIGIGIALVVLRVPLALALVLLTFIAAFVPIVGATVAGTVAVAVAFVARGPTTALLVLAAVLLVQQLEGHLLHPLVMRRAVRLHPVVTLLAIGVGTLLAGIAGAVVAVPTCAFVYHAVAGYRAAARAELALPAPPTDDDTDAEE